MLRGVINHAASAAGSMVAGYLARASVAVPFIIGFGFATTALSLLLIDRFGHRDAFLIIAGIFTLLGVLAALTVSGKERGNAANAVAYKTDSPPVARDAAATAAVAMPFAVLGTVLTSFGPAPFLSLLGILGRNLPLVLVLGAAGVLVWPKTIGEPGIAPAHAGANPTAISTGPNLKAVDTLHRRSMALGTFVIGVLLVGAALCTAFGPLTPALPTPFVIS